MKAVKISLLTNSMPLWSKLEKREVALVNNISRFMARDVISLSNLKELITKPDQTPPGTPVTIKVYPGQTPSRILVAVRFYRAPMNKRVFQ